MATIPATITVTVPDDVDIQNMLKVCVDKLDPANAGSDYVNRFETVTRAKIIAYWKEQMLNGKRDADVQAAIEAVAAIDANTLIS